MPAPRQPEFWQRVVELVHRGDKPIAELAKSLGQRVVTAEPTVVAGQCPLVVQDPGEDGTLENGADACRDS